MSIKDDLLFIDNAADGGLGAPDYFEAYQRVWKAVDQVEKLTAKLQAAEAEVARLGELLRQAEFGLVSGPTWGQALKDARQAATEAALRWGSENAWMVASKLHGADGFIARGLAALLGEGE